MECGNVISNVILVFD